MELELSLILLLACVAFAAGFLDAIAGGGGLVTLPALLVAGLDPLAAIATNKVQSSCASVSATVSFARKGMIEWRSGLPMAALSFLAGGTGALAAGMLPRGALEQIIPVLLVMVAVYFAWARTPDKEARKARMPPLAFALLIVPAIGFYDGIFGPGTGSFFLVAFVMLMGQGLLSAMSSSKLMNAACNLGSLWVFSLTGTILWPLALAMAAGAFIGAHLGARCAIRFGPRLIKPLLITVCLVMAMKLMVGVPSGPSPSPPADITS